MSMAHMPALSAMPWFWVEQVTSCSRKTCLAALFWALCHAARTVQHDCQDEEVKGAHQWTGLKLQPPRELESWVAEGMAARRCLPLLAALVHVPALHAAELEDSNSLPASTPSALALQVCTQARLAQGKVFAGRASLAMVNAIIKFQEECINC